MLLGNPICRTNCYQWKRWQFPKISLYSILRPWWKKQKCTGCGQSRLTVCRPIAEERGLCWPEAELHQHFWKTGTPWCKGTTIDAKLTYASAISIITPPSPAPSPRLPFLICKMHKITVHWFRSPAQWLINIDPEVTDQRHHCCKLALLTDIETKINQRSGQRDLKRQRLGDAHQPALSFLQCQKVTQRCPALWAWSA